MSFAAQVKAFELKAKAAANTSVCKAVETLFTSVVFLSPSPSHPGPYAKGVLSNQYYPMIGGNFSSALTTSRSANGADSIARIKTILASSPFLGKDNKITLTNNTPYVYHAEMLGWKFGGGPNGQWKGATPYKMVALSVLKLKAIYI